MGNDTKSNLIVEASARVFPKLGYHNATVEDILREANVARSTFYVYFPNKRELFTCVVEGIMKDILLNLERGVSSIIERFDPSLAPAAGRAEVEQALVDLMAGVYHYMDENGGMTRVFLHELVGIDDEMTGFFHGFQEGVTDQFERLIRFGVERNLLREVNQRRAADFIVGGLIHLARKMSARIGEFEIEQVCREFVEMHLRGLYRLEAA